MLIYAIIAVCLAVILAELFKTIMHYYRHQELVIFHDGGMPSTHTSAVAALCLAVYYEQGFTLLLFVCIAFSIVVAHDAYNVRWEVTKHSDALNKLTKSKKYFISGHTKQEVFAGLVLGLLITYIVYLF